MRRAMVLALLGCAVAAAAEFPSIRLEAQPFVGFRFGGNIHPGGKDLTLPTMSLKSSRAWGASVTASGLDGVVMGELAWSRQPTSGISASGAADVRLDQFLLHGIIGVPEKNRRLRPLPYVLFGGGLTHIQGAGTFGSKYAYSFGGGFRCYVTRRMGIRFQGRFSPTHLYDTGQASYVYGNSAPVPVEKYFHQGEFTVGWIFRPW
jgi:hypothetical protein